MPQFAVLGILSLAPIPLVAGLGRAQETRPREGEVARQRATNDRFYASDYLERREALFAKSAGKWLAIVAGESTSPADTLAECLRAADAKDSRALHRFVFRVGEDGPVSYQLGGAQESHQVGIGFFGHLGIHPMKFDVGDGELTCWRGEKRKLFRIEDNQISVPMGEPGGTVVRPIRVCASTGFTGVARFDPAVAMELGLARFEIPGEASLEDAFGARAACRRARVRVEVAELGIDECLPVVVGK